LATPGSDQDAKPRITTDHAEQIEGQIDALSERVPPLRSFILPGGTGLAARLHVARTVCRRAERGVVELAQTEPVDPAAPVYLNRLADLLFVLARVANAEAGVDDVPWTPEV
jgi:cob(I)alamin adenosyltransferase